MPEKQRPGPSGLTPSQAVTQVCLALLAALSGGDRRAALGRARHVDAIGSVTASVHTGRGEAVLRPAVLLASGVARVAAVGVASGRVLESVERVEARPVALDLVAVAQ